MFEINNDRPVVNVFITKEYDKFKGTEDNRTTLDCTIDDLRKDPDRRKLIESMIEKGGNLQPIIVNKDGVISEGHNRFIIARDLGLPLKYEILDSNLDEAINLSSTNKDWKPIDLLNRAIVREVPIAMVIKDVIEKFPYLTIKKNSSIGHVIVAKLVINCIRKMDSNLIPTYDNLFTKNGKRLLSNSKDIEELKTKEIPNDVLKQLYNEMRIFNDMIKMTHDELPNKQDIEKYSFDYLTLNIASVSALSDWSKFIVSHEDIFTKKFKEKVKFRKNTSDKAMRDYIDLTSSDFKTVKNAFDELIKNCIK